MITLNKHKRPGITTQYAVKLKGKLIILISVYKRTGWFKVLGKGIGWKHVSCRKSFSERMGFRRYLRLFNYRFYFIKNIV